MLFISKTKNVAILVCKRIKIVRTRYSDIHAQPRRSRAIHGNSLYITARMLPYVGCNKKKLTLTLVVILLVVFVMTIMNALIYERCRIYIGKYGVSEVIGNLDSGVSKDLQSHDENVANSLVNTERKIGKLGAQHASPIRRSDVPPAWRMLSTALSIYSSYYDKRQIKTEKGLFKNSVVIFGYELGSAAHNLSCVLKMNTSGKMLFTVKRPAVGVMIAELWKDKDKKYRSYVYRCHLSTAERPRYVTLVKDFVNIKDVPSTSFITVFYPYIPVPKHKFGVCYGSPVHSYRYDQEIMDSIEMNRILGATWFTIYIYEAHEKAMQILRYYSQEVKILDAVFNWGENMPSPVFNRGQLVALHDCVYRNMYKVSFLVLCDLDELIMPVDSLNWHKLISEIDRPERGHFVFRHLGFFKAQNNRQEVVKCPGKSDVTYKMPRYFLTYNRSVAVLKGNKLSKSIAKPRFSITVHVHTHREMIPGYMAYIVQPKTAVMKHFRDKPNKTYRNDQSTLDYSMNYFKPSLLAAIEKHYCQNILRKSS